VPYALPGPKSKTPTDTSTVPFTGNFTWHDDFSAEELSSLWLMLRTPKETWWALDGGFLRLTPRAELLSGKGNPSFFARRVQHARFDATTSLAVPADTGVSAGLVAFQNETHYYYLGIRRTADGLSVFLECANGKAPELLASAEISEAPNLQLRIVGEEKLVSFAYAAAPGSWQTLISGADVMPITVQAAGGGLHFTGAVLGLHARIEP
jgi:xylan 1,4-beta-xylosidase